MAARNVPDDPDDIDDDDDDDAAEVYLPTEQEIDQVVQRGIRAAAKGENVDYLLEVMTGLFPAKASTQVAKKFSNTLAQKNLPVPSSDPDRSPRSKLIRLHRMFVKIMEQQAVARVKGMVKDKPEVAADVNKQGKRLVRKGVKDDKVPLTGADLGTMTAPAPVKPKRDQGKKSGREK